MDPTNTSSLEQSDLDKLNDKDKAELRTFLANEQQRTRIQGQTHTITEMCWTKCVTGMKGSALDKNEDACLANCVNRFLDANFLTVKHLANLRQG